MFLRWRWEDVVAVDVSGRLGPIRDRVVGSDPGLNRLRAALACAVAMSSTLGVELLFCTLTGAGAQGTVVAMLLGAVVAMMGSMALSGPARWRKVRTAGAFPVAIGLGMVAGVSVDGHTDLMLGTFVLVMFAAVFVRRFGLDFFFYGFMTWMGYFFAAFLDASMEMVPPMLAAVSVATGWLLLLSLTVLRTNVRRTLRRTTHAFGARARAVAAAAEDLLRTGPGEPRQAERARRRLHARQLRLAETALVIEAWSAEPNALPDGWSAGALRRHLLDAQLAMDSLAAGAVALADCGGSTPAARIAGCLARRDHPAAERAAHALLDAGPAHPDADGRWPAQHLAAAALEFTTVARRADGPPPVAGAAHPEDFEPVVTLAMGDLPGSAAVAGDVTARGAGWNPLSRLSLTSRQAVQVAVAGALAIVAGRYVSETRYYWAVIAAFIAFTGVGTRSETFLKAVNRVLGTLLGLGAGIVLAHLTAGHVGWVLFVVVASMSCGFYLVRLSYASMIFFVTIMVAQLYSVLRVFSAGLLVLRLEETAVGAAIGIAVGLVVLPTSTRDTVHVAWGRFCTALAELLRGVADQFEQDAGTTALEPALVAAAGEAVAREPDRAATAADEPDGTTAPAVPASADIDTLVRTVDSRLQQLALVSRPLTRPLIWGHDPRLTRHRLILCGAVAHQSRALAAPLRRQPPACRPAVLAASCRTMAYAAEALAVATPAGIAAPRPADTRPPAAQPVHPATDTDEQLSRAQHALLAHPRTADPSDPARVLVRLRQLLEDLAHPGGVACRPDSSVGTDPLATGATPLAR